MRTYMNQCLQLLLAASFILISSCGSKSNMKSEESKSNDEIYTIIEQGDMSNHDTKEVMIINTTEQLNEIYSKINSTRRPGLPIPKIDFDNYSVIAAFAGTKSTGGHSVVIEPKVDDGTLHFNCSMNSPDPMQPATMAITTPFMIVKALKSDKKITASF